MAWYRKKTYGFPIAGYYDQMPLTKNKIVIPDNLPEELEAAIIQHEEAHHEQYTEPKFYWTTKLSWIGILGLIPGIYFKSDPVMAVSIGLVALMPFIEHFYVVEKEANQDIDWEAVWKSVGAERRSKPARYFEYFLYVILVLPGNLEELVRTILGQISATLDSRSNGTKL